MYDENEQFESKATVRPCLRCWRPEASVMLRPSLRACVSPPTPHHATRSRI